MATGPEHYRRAEEHLAAAYVASIDDGTAAYHHARAQVHATLAVAPRANDDGREAPQLLRYQRDAAVAEINTLRSVVWEYMRLPDGSDREAMGAQLIALIGGIES